MSISKKTRTNENFSRRHFLLGGAAVVAAAGCARIPKAPVMAGLEAGAKASPHASVDALPGIQLYTVREQMAGDVPGTLRQIAAIGYKKVETAGYHGTPPAQMRMILSDLGLSAPSGHCNGIIQADDAEAQLDAAAEVGHDYVTLGWFAPEYRERADQFRLVADQCNAMAERCRERGMRFAYHNHDFEFMTLDGEVPYDILMERTDPSLVDFELDLYWVRKAGRDILPLLASAPERFTMCHVKDMGTDGAMADVGTGTIDFAGIFASDKARFRHYFVERDDAPRPMESAEVSYGALSDLLGRLYN